MRTYEIMVVCSQEDEAIKYVTNFFKELFKNNIIKEQILGIKELAYEINKQKKAHYSLYILKASNEQLQKIRYEQKVNKSIYRVLIINLEKEFNNYKLYIEGKLKTKFDKKIELNNNSYKSNKRRFSNNSSKNDSSKTSNTSNNLSTKQNTESKTKKEKSADGK